ncbi:c-type cytochrome [Methyloceanibacter sp.]|uniref:c-type cytochrome n=1 Tax=Methyloceanibacter sp. TaxID=1965321 RepID=UPI003D6CDB6B
MPARSIGEAAWSVVKTGLTASVALLVATLSANAAEKTLIDKGEVLVRENCSRCHAIGKEGDSPHKEAPPFRTLAKNYPIEDLAESLAEGIVSGHPDMPIFVFGPHDVEALIEYLQSIQAQ